MIADTVRTWNPLVNTMLNDTRIRQEDAKFAKAPPMTVEQLLPGDLIVLSGGSAMRNALRYATSSQFNHVAIHIGDGYVIDATNSFGVSRRRLSDLMDGTVVFAGVLRRDGLTMAQRNTIVLEAGYRLGAQYSTWAEAGLATGSTTAQPGCKSGEPVNCSELAQNVYYSALGYRLTHRDYPSPGDLALAPGLKAIGRLKG